MMVVVVGYFKTIDIDLSCAQRLGLGEIITTMPCLFLDPTDDASGSAIMEMDTEPIIHGVFSAMVDVEDTINVTPDRDDAPHDPESAFESHSYYQRLLESVRREDALSANIQSEPMEESVAEEDGTENIDDSEITVGGDGAGSDDEQDGDEEPGGEKLYQLPISKVKKIMKTDPDTKLITKDALAAMAISTVSQVDISTITITPVKVTMDLLTIRTFNV